MENKENRENKLLIKLAILLVFMTIGTSFYLMNTINKEKEEKKPEEKQEETIPEKEVIAILSKTSINYERNDKVSAIDENGMINSDINELNGIKIRKTIYPMSESTGPKWYYFLTENDDLYVYDELCEIQKEEHPECELVKKLELNVKDIGVLNVYVTGDNLFYDKVFYKDNNDVIYEINTIRDDDSNLITNKDEKDSNSLKQTEGIINAYNDGNIEFNDVMLNINYDYLILVKQFEYLIVEKDVVFEIKDNELKEYGKIKEIKSNSIVIQLQDGTIYNYTQTI